MSAHNNNNTMDLYNLYNNVYLYALQLFKLIYTYKIQLHQTYYYDYIY